MHTPMKKSITSRFIKTFMIITISILVICSIFMFEYQQTNYIKNTTERMKIIAESIHDEIMNDEDNFMAFMQFMHLNRDKIVIKPDFTKDNYESDKTKFYRQFMIKYPSKIYGTDISFDEMDQNLKILYCTWYQEYWTSRFDELTEKYSLPYLYFVYPTDNGTHILYVFDYDRKIDESKNDGRLLLWEDWEENYDEMPILFKVWYTCKETDEIDSFDNEYGRTYTYYKPVIINNTKIGLICVDSNIDKINKAIYKDTFMLMSLMGFVIISGTIYMIRNIKKRYIERIEKLNSCMEEYAREKNSTITDVLSQDIKNEDEIDSLSWQMISMIQQIQSHLAEVIKMSHTLDTTQDKMKKFIELSETDSLTGLGNKTGYMKIIETLEKQIKENKAEFAIIMIDLNFLKKINDENGHDKGDMALKKTADYIRGSFAGYPSYRIGGDEFVVIAMNNDKIINIDKCIDKLKKYQTSDTSDMPWEHISVAYGYSIYNSIEDTNVNDVFVKADKHMYEIKKKMKAIRTN